MAGTPEQNRKARFGQRLTEAVTGTLAAADLVSLVIAPRPTAPFEASASLTVLWGIMLNERRINSRRTKEELADLEQSHMSTLELFEDYKAGVARLSVMRRIIPFFVSFENLFPGINFGESEVRAFDLTFQDALLVEGGKRSPERQNIVDRARAKLQPQLTEAEDKLNGSWSKEKLSTFTNEIAPLWYDVIEGLGNSIFPPDETLREALKRNDIHSISQEAHEADGKFDAEITRFQEQQGRTKPLDQEKRAIMETNIAAILRVFDSYKQK